MNTHFSLRDSGALSTHETESNQRRLKDQTLVLALGALGVVYGDIGTSPLYAIRECFHGHHAIALTQGNIFGVMLTRKVETKIPLKEFLQDVALRNIPRAQGTAIFMPITPEGTPPVLIKNLKHKKVLHEKVVVLSILSTDVPIVPSNKRVSVEDLGCGFYRVVAYNGFMQRPIVPEIVKLASRLGLPIDEAETTYFLGRVTLFTAGDSKMMRWRKALFAFMTKNAGTPVTYFGLPANRVVELSAQIQL